MAGFKEYSFEQSRFIPVSLSQQIQPGTIEYTINYLVDNEIDLSAFGRRFHNDENGAPAFDPAILLKIVLFAYSRGIISSRKIAQCCEENVVFMALSAMPKGSSGGGCSPSMAVRLRPTVPRSGAEQRRSC